MLSFKLTILNFLLSLVVLIKSSLIWDGTIKTGSLNKYLRVFLKNLIKNKVNFQNSFKIREKLKFCKLKFDFEFLI